MIHENLSEAIIGSGMAVLNALRPGLDEKIFERALRIELEHRGMVVSSQIRYPVFYRDVEVGLLVPDLIVDEKVLVETKVVTAFHDEHLAQVLGYLSISGLELGLLLNFKYSKLQWKRIANSSRCH